MDRKCSYCGHRILGRTDKRFCNDYCRNTYNNKRYRKQRLEQRKVEGVLRRNYKILKQLCPSMNTVAETHMDVLKGMGYELRFFTQYETTSSGDGLRKCYDLGMIQNKKGQVKIFHLPS
jgi:hypothetical protein